MRFKYGNRTQLATSQALHAIQAFEAAHDLAMVFLCIAAHRQRRAYKGHAKKKFEELISGLRSQSSAFLKVAALIAGVLCSRRPHGRRSLKSPPSWRAVFEVATLILGIL